MKAVNSSLQFFEHQTNLEKGPRVALMEIVAELRDPGNNEQNSMKEFMTENFKDKPYFFNSIMVYVVSMVENFNCPLSRFMLWDTVC